ncbi:MAG: type II toxin-antitoxin system CcdA family antitoxin [Symbiopectobacterium sp.]
MDNDVIGKEARSIIAEHWKEHNREGMEEAAIFMAQNGSFAV